MAQVLETIIAINAKVGNGFSAVGAQLQQLGALVNGISQGLIDFGNDSIEIYKDYEKSMADAEVALSTIYGRNTSELSGVMSQLDTTATEWAASTIFHTNDVANAISEAAHAGWDLNQIMTGIPAAMELAQAGGIDLSQAVDYIVKSTNAAGIEFDDIGSFIDHWAYAANSSATNIEELGDAMLRMGGTMKFAENTDELLTLLAVTADAGYTGQEAGTLIRNSMLRLIAPTKKAKEAMEQLGATSEETSSIMGDEALAAANARLEETGFSAYDADGNLKSMLDTYRDLYVALGEVAGGYDKITENEEALGILSSIFPTRSITSALTLLEGAATGYKGLYEELNSGLAEGYGEYAAGTAMDTLYGKTETFESKMERLKQLVGEELAPDLEKVMGFAGDLVDSIAQIDEGPFSAIVSGLEVVAAAGPGLGITGGAMRLIGTVAGSAAAQIGLAAIAAVAFGSAMHDLAETSFEEQFGTNELDISEVENYVSRLREQFESSREEINQFNSLLQEAATAYENTSKTLSSGLLSKTVTGNKLTKEDKDKFISMGRELGEDLMTGMDNALAGTYASMSQMFEIGTEEQSISGGMWQHIVDMLGENYETQKARLEEMSKGLVEAMTSAFKDDKLTGEELQNIQSYINQMNEIYANELKADQARQQAEIIAKSQALGWNSAQESLDMVDDAIAQRLIALSGEQAYNRQVLVNSGATEEELAVFDDAARRQLNINEAEAAGFRINTFDALLRGSDMGDAYSAIQSFAQAVQSNGGLPTSKDIADLTSAVSPEDAASIGGVLNNLAERMGGFAHMEELYDQLSQRNDEESRAAAEQIDYALAVLQAAQVLAMNQSNSENLTRPIAETLDHGLSQVSNIAKEVWNAETQEQGVPLDKLSGWSDIDLSTAGILGQLQDLAAANLGVPDVQEYLSALNNPDYQWPIVPQIEEMQDTLAGDPIEVPVKGEIEEVDTENIPEQATQVDITANISNAENQLDIQTGVITPEVNDVTITPQVDMSAIPTDMGPVQMPIEPVIEGDLAGQDAIQDVEGETVTVNVDGDTGQLQGAITENDGQQLTEIVNGDNANLYASIWDLDGQTIITYVDGDTSSAQGAINALNGQTVYINVVAQSVSAPVGGYAEGGRADTPSIFGEAGPEWAIPEEHTENTRKLLAKAAEASGFSLLEIAGVTKEAPAAASSGSDEAKSMTIVYSPTINASNVDGVEKALGDDKKAFIRYMKEKLMFDRMEVYA